MEMIPSEPDTIKPVEGAEKSGKKSGTFPPAYAPNQKHNRKMAGMEKL
jgi:hypothetical protein